MSEMEAVKENILVNDGRLEILLMNIYCSEQRPETYAAKGSLSTVNADEVMQVEFPVKVVRMSED